MKKTYSLPELPDVSTPSPANELTEAMCMIAHQFEKSEKKRRKLEKKINKMLKSDKKPKSKGKKGKSGKRKKGKRTNMPDWVDQATSTALKVVEMYAESQFFPDGRKKPKE